MGMEPRLVEVSSLPVFYADGIGMVTVEGANARLIFFEYRMLGAERVRMPVLEVIRPVASVVPNLLSGIVKAQCAANIASPLRH